MTVTDTAPLAPFTADEIAILRSALTRAPRSNPAARALVRVFDCLADHARLSCEVVQLTKDNACLLWEVEDAQVNVRRMSEALKPFAALLDDEDESDRIPDYANAIMSWHGQGSVCAPRFSAEAVRRAKVAYEQSQIEGPR